MKTSKLLSVILVIAILTTSLLSINSFGSGSKSSDSGLYKNQKLSKAEIVQLVSDVNLNDYMNFYVSQPSVTYPYSMGEVRTDMQLNALDRLNAYRKLAGLDSVSLNDEYTEYAQAASVVNAANDQMTHYPTQPADMPNDLYNAGSYGASHSNIACYMGYAPKIGPLSFSVDLWMDDSDEYNIAQLGHRRWILNPTMEYTGFGCATATSGFVHTSVYAFDKSAEYSDYDFISWPPSGYMPNDTEFFTTNCAWSISLNPSKYDISDLSNVDVEIEDKNDNDWDFEGDSDDDGFFSIDLGGYGSNRNAIIFRPEGIEKYEGKYTVTVEGLKTNANTPTTLTFEVEFFSAKNYVPPVTTTTVTTTETTTETTTAVTTTETTTKAPDISETTTIPPVTTTEIQEPDSSEFFETTTEEPSTTVPTTKPTTTAPTTTTPPDITVVPGDANGDNRVNASDARLALRISAKLEVPTEEQFKAADVNGDGKINASDARKILRVSAKLDVFETETEAETENVSKEPANDTVVTTTVPNESSTAEQPTASSAITTSIPVSVSFMPATTRVTADTTKTPAVTTTQATTTKLNTTVAQTTAPIHVSTSKPQPYEPSTDMAVFVISTGNEYHDIECAFILADDILVQDIFAIARSEAEQLGYTPCNDCLG